MAVSIVLDACISCNLCVPVCPNRAIAELNTPRGPEFVVDPDLCTECHSFYDTPQCLSVCPLEDECVIYDPKEADDVLEERAKVLGDYRESINYPRNYSYAEAPGMPAAPGEYGPKPEKEAA